LPYLSPAVLRELLLAADEFLDDDRSIDLRVRVSWYLPSALRRSSVVV